MRIGLVGVGRLGKVLAGLLRPRFAVDIFDQNTARMESVADELGLVTAGCLEEIAGIGTVILAVPDREVLNCIKEFNQIGKPLSIFNVATNVSQHVLESTASRHIKCTGVKFVAHAGEMSLGSRPVIIVNERPFELAVLAVDIFQGVGEVLIGKADNVTNINKLAAEAALEAAVFLEDNMGRQGFSIPIIKSAIRQVAAGVLKAYADEDLGPFAREIVQAIKAKIKK